MRSARIELILDTLKAVRGAKDLSKATDDLADNLGDTARQGDKAGRAIDDVGDQMSQAARAAAGLDRQIDKLSGSLREMAISQALTGQNFTRQIRLEQAEVGRLTKNRKLLGDFGGGAGPGFGKSLISGISDAAAAVRPILMPALAGVAVAASPFIAATIAGAVVGAAGVGGVVGGLALAAKDPRVQAEGKNLGEEVMRGLTTRAEVFVAPALLGVQKVRAAWRDFDGDLQRVFDSSSGFVAPLINGLLSGALKVGRGFTDAVVSAKPVIDQLGRTFDQLGGAVGVVFTDMGRHAEEGALAIRDLTDATVGLIHGVNDIIGPLATLYGWVSKANGAFKDFTGGLSILEALDPLTPLKKLAEGLWHVVTGSDEGAKSLGTWHDGALAAASAASVVAVTTDDVSAAQKRLTDIQGVLTTSLSSLGGASSVAGQRSAALKTAMDNLYGAAIRNTDANEAYQASVDALSGSVKSNGRSLSINTVAGRANRDALEALLTSSGELYVSNIAAGVSIGQATAKHQNRIAAIKEESKRLGLNTGKTQDLINTYGQIPKKKQTDLIVGKLGDVVTALKDLYLFQRALADGIPIASERGKLNKVGPDKRFGGYAAGGYTGAGAKHEPAGIVHRDEFVVRKEARRSVERQAPGFLNELNATGQMPGYARGGTVAPIDTSTRWPFRTNLAGTKVMSRAEASSKVMPKFGNWPSSPGAQRGDSGVWRSIVALIKSTGLGGSFGNAYRPGDPLWHGSGRAVDWMGFNQDPLASFLAARRPLELIHRTAKRDYAYTRGVNKGSFNEGLMEAHRNHVHIAMANGGMLREPVFGYGMRSGNSYSLAERGPERVLSAAQTARGGGGNTYVTVQAGYIVTPQQLENKLTEVFDRLQSKGRVR